MLAGEPKFEASQDIPDVPYSRFAELLGLKGIRVERPEEIEVSLKEALQADRPTVLDFVVDGNVPISPPHLIKEQLVNFSKAMLKGDPESANLIRQSIRDMMQGGTGL